MVTPPNSPQTVTLHEALSRRKEEIEHLQRDNGHVLEVHSQIKSRLLKQTARICTEGTNTPTSIRFRSSRSSTPT